MRVNYSLPGRPGDRTAGEKGEGLGVRERIRLQLSPPEAPGYFLAEGGPQRQAFSGEGLSQAQEES